jgi:multicomponent Na+:H+ antiporter subunit E
MGPGKRSESIVSAPGAEVRNVSAPSTLASALSRAVAFFGLWLLLTSAAPADLAAGLLAAVAASWVSLRLMPAEQGGLRPVSFVKFLLHFLRQSIVAGTEVALLALNPRLPLRAGFVIYQPHLPPGTRRNVFCAITSLMPGTLPCGSADDNGLTIHCLDVTQPVLGQLSAEETLCIQTLGEGPRDG